MGSRSIIIIIRNNNIREIIYNKILISILGLLSDLDISAEPDYVSGIKLIDNWDTTNGQYINKGDNFTYSNGIITVKDQKCIK